MHEHHHNPHPGEMGSFRAELDRRYPALYRRLMPYIEEAHMRGQPIAAMDESQLDHMAWQIMGDSGVLHHMPPGHTAETVKDLVKVMLLTQGDMEPAAEAMSPLFPLIWGMWPGDPFFYYPFFFGPRGRFRHHHHHRRPGSRGPHRGRGRR